jgi:hypothetical protein
MHRAVGRRNDRVAVRPEHPAAAEGAEGQAEREQLRADEDGRRGEQADADVQAARHAELRDRGRGRPVGRRLQAPDDEHHQHRADRVRAHAGEAAHPRVPAERPAPAPHAPDAGVSRREDDDGVRVPRRDPRRGPGRRAAEGHRSRARRDRDGPPAAAGSAAVPGPRGGPGRGRGRRRAAGRERGVPARDGAGRERDAPRHRGRRPLDAPGHARRAHRGGEDARADQRPAGRGARGHGRRPRGVLRRPRAPHREAAARGAPEDEEHEACRAPAAARARGDGRAAAPGRGAPGRSARRPPSSTPTRSRSSAARWRSRASTTGAASGERWNLAALFLGGFRWSRW